MNIPACHSLFGHALMAIITGGTPAESRIAAAALEQFETGTEARFTVWAEQVETMSGITLDGDELDFARDAFLEGATASEHALSLADKAGA